MTFKGRRIDPTETINQVVERDPRALAVLDAHGLDTCCGGPLTLAEAARRHGLDLANLLATLEASSE